MVLEVFCPVVQSILSKTGTFGTIPDCPSERYVRLIESGGNVTAVILKLNLFVMNTHVCLTCSKQLKLGNSDRKLIETNNFLIMQLKVHYKQTFKVSLSNSATVYPQPLPNCPLTVSKVFFVRLREVSFL